MTKALHRRMDKVESAHSAKSKPGIAEMILGGRERIKQRPPSIEDLEARLESARACKAEVERAGGARPFLLRSLGYRIACARLRVLPGEIKRLKSEVSNA